MSLLRYNLHSIVFTCFKCPALLFLVTVMSCATSTSVQLQNISILSKHLPVSFVIVTSCPQPSASENREPSLCLHRFAFSGYLTEMESHIR